ncbi:MAG: hypothetical protein NC923_07285 [Candidatus Omnitrophica bacterium]|nr:hypothetical protein [Candidatus Omnitrophota bacterium]
MFFQKYFPRSFCREYVEVKGDSSQFSMFMATVLGIKPLMDDWIPVAKVDEFKKVCRKYRLKVREDIIFLGIPKDKVSSSVLGKEYITTTSAFGVPLDSGIDGKVHLFISKDRSLLKKGMWYPVIIKGRMIIQPRIDSLKYGYALGYPECCIKFYRKYNNWLKFSHLYEIYRNTQNKPSFLCNPFLKDTSFSYIYHMPCGYDCFQTIKLAGRLRYEIEKRESGYVRLTDKYLKMPFLVFYERKFYAFEGVMRGRFIKYNKVYFPSPDKAQDIYGKVLAEGDSLELQGMMLNIYRKNKKIKSISIPFNNNFAPEYPFLIQFF